VYHCSLQSSGIGFVATGEHNSADSSTSRANWQAINADVRDVAKYIVVGSNGVHSPQL
jgi:hypothetical protein